MKPARMTFDELLVAHALVSAASPGPWRHETTWNNGGMALADLDMPGSCTGAKMEMLDCDAAFIAASRALVPALLREIALLTFERDAARRPPLPTSRFDCPECDVKAIAVDEDGCCAACGAEATVQVIQ